MRFVSLSNATQQALVDIGASSISLQVVRAQGLDGQVSVEWITIDGSARSSGKIPPDFVVRGTSNCSDISFINSFIHLNLTTAQTG